MSPEDPNNANNFPELTREPLQMGNLSANDNQGGQLNNSHTSRGKEEDLSDRILRDMQKGDTLSALHPYQSTLTTRHVESSIVLENLCFPPHQAASKEKVR
jgi:hypothetical protein